MDLNEILSKIIRRYGVLSENIREVQIVESKLKKRKATYADAERCAQEIGQALVTALREYLPEAKTDGRLYRAAAEVVLEQPMKAAGQDVARIAESIQQILNEEAGIGMRAIVPEMNQDQIDGIITGICNADSYEAGKETLFSQVENCMEGYVDDFVRENADFHYGAGLSPTIERIPVGNCCKWCDQLAGKYLYEEVRDRGNDVFRRHKNCHCQILYNPRDGSRRRQNVHTKKWFSEDPEETRERKIRFGSRERFSRDGEKEFLARRVKNYTQNNLWISENVNLSPRQIRRINDQIIQAEELHGITGKCKSNFIIVDDELKLASYSPKQDQFIISARMANTDVILKLQQGYACPGDQRSTMVHELFHWKDAEEYRTNIGTIESSTRDSVYTQFQQGKAKKALQEAGVDLTNPLDIQRKTSAYGLEKVLDNDFEETYTEFRTRSLLEGGK